MAEKNTKRPWIIFGMMLGMLMSALDNSIVSTAMPTVVAQLGGLDIFSWVFSAYLLTSTTFIPIFGKLADLYGKKLFYLLGLTVFLIGSALSATSGTMIQLIVYRAIQGIGAAAMFPITFAMIMEIFPPEARGKMQGLFSAVFGISAVAGPTLGAYFTDYLSWHWCFLINIPFGLIAILLIGMFYKEAPREAKKVVIDYAGSITLSLAIVAMMLGLVMGGQDYAWDSWQILSLLIGAGVLLVLFLLIERKAKEPVIPLNLFNSKLISSTGSSFLQGVIMIAATSYIPLFIQGVIGGSATSAGNLLTPMMLSLVVGSTIGGMTMAKVPFRVPMIISALLMGVGTYLLAQIDISTSKTYMVFSMIVLGLGIGPLMPVTMMLTQTAVGPRNIGIATSLVAFFRNIGMALGVSILGVIVNNKMADKVTEIAAQMPIPADKLAHLKDPRALFSAEAQQFIPPNVFELLKTGMGEAIAIVFLICVFVSVGSLLLAFLAGNARLSPPQGVPGNGAPTQPSVQK
ncbi:MAG: MDR family MFS transporter [Tumebacillaceae bacterium]